MIVRSWNQIMLAATIERKAKNKWLRVTSNVFDQSDYHLPITKYYHILSLKFLLTIALSAYHPPCVPPRMRLYISVTRFGEILPLCKNLQSVGQFFKGLFTIWQNFDHTLANFVCHWANFHWCIWRNVENNPAIWSHCYLHIRTLVNKDKALVNRGRFGDTWILPPRLRYLRQLPQ